jgi:hypothetical protein
MKLFINKNSSSELIEWLKAVCEYIEDDANNLTAGNLSHHRPSIRWKATRMKQVLDALPDKIKQEKEKEDK